MKKPVQKVLLLDPDVHDQIKGAARDSGMKLQALGNAVLRAWRNGDYFVCPGTGVVSIPATRGSGKKGNGK